jgi:hypothetical protein
MGLQRNRPELGLKHTNNQCVYAPKIGQADLMPEADIQRTRNPKLDMHRVNKPDLVKHRWYQSKALKDRVKIATNVGLGRSMRRANLLAKEASQLCHVKERNP